MFNNTKNYVINYIKYHKVINDTPARYILILQYLSLGISQTTRLCRENIPKVTLNHDQYCVVDVD